MSGGYLQRLIDAVAVRGDSLHPRTGSIFSPYRAETNPPLHAWEEAADTETVSQQKPQADATSSELELPAPARSLRPNSEHVPLLPNAVAQDTRSTEQEAPAFRAALGPDPDGRSIASRDGQTVEPLRSRLFPASAVDVDDGLRTLIRPNVLSRADTALAERRQLPRERQTLRVERPADDIQIHIGRIEVTAVPPSVQPAPRAPDRSLSLDAYLNRRNGRAR
jgi:hypothetical protein